MPKTAFQGLVFGTMMALIMVYGMEVYNAALLKGGLSRACFHIPVIELLLLAFAVSMLEKVVGGPVARRLARWSAARMPDRRVPLALLFPFFMVCSMCPLMSVVAVLAFKWGGGELAAKWLQTVKFNFPMALGWQIVIAGPLVRFLFREMFRPELPQGPELPQEISE